MKYPTLSLFVLFMISIQSCIAQQSSEEIYTERFNWTINIPEGFMAEGRDAWAKRQDQGKEMIEDTYDEEVINLSTVLFVFKSGEFNLIEANYQPFELDDTMTYEETNREVRNIIYETFYTQMPDAVIDTTFSTETIDGLEFHKFEIEILYPNGTTLYAFMFSRLFGEEEFSTNIFYIDPKEGKKLLTAWRNSRFK